MARSSLANSSPKLNLSRRQAALFQRIILSGNHMAEFLAQLDQKVTVPKRAAKLSVRWGKLMIELVEMLF